MPALCFPTKVEIEFQRTNVALGRPVDHEKLFEIVEEAERDAREAIGTAMRNGEMDQLEAKCMRDAINIVVAKMDELLNDFTLRIIDRLKLIDRNVVATVLKENMDKIREMSKTLEKSR